MNKGNFKIPVEFEKINDLNCGDNRFTRVKIWIMHLGANYNGSYFEKEPVDNAIPTLSYIPIVGFIEENKFGEKDFSDHRFITIKTENGKEEKYAGHAYGVVLAEGENNAHYEKKICDDGVEREFLVVEGITWNMFDDSSDIIKKSFSKGQSMELQECNEDGSLAYEGYEDENGFYHFTKFSFRAACFLGDDYEPAMINSKIEVQFSLHKFIDDIYKEMNKKVLLYSNAVKEIKKGEETVDNSKKKEPTNFSQTYKQMFEDVKRVVRELKETDKDGWTHYKYYLRDIQDDIVIVEEFYSGKLIGFPLSFNGDTPVIDFDNGVRKKATYVDYEEGSADSGESDGAATNSMAIFANEVKATFTKKIEELESAITEKEKTITEANTMYSELSKEYDSMKEQVETSKKKLENEKKHSEIEKYESVLSGVLEYEKMKESIEDVSYEDVVNKCAVMFSKKALESFSPNHDSGKLSSKIVGNEDDEHDSYTTKYGDIPKNFN